MIECLGDVTTKLLYITTNCSKGKQFIFSFIFKHLNITSAWLASLAGRQAAEAAFRP